ncbi:MAG: DUF2914 domain-containing protein, partial [Sedimenticolaceae bacterium]
AQSMKFRTLSFRAGTVAALITSLPLISLAAFAVDTSPTQAEKAMVAAEKTAPGSVTRATFTTAIEDGEPIDFQSEIENSVLEVFFFTEVEGVAGQSITHRWKYGSEVMATAEFDVKDDPEKVWSSQKMRPEWTGAWEVEVVAGSTKSLHRRRT